MNTQLTQEEHRAIARNRRRRGGQITLLVLSAILMVITAIVLIGVFQESGGSNDVPEWILVPLVLGIVFLGGVIRVGSYIAGKLKTEEKALFVKASLTGFKASGGLTDSKISKIFTRITDGLTSKSRKVVERELVSESWPLFRAANYTGLVDFLLEKCEWNINYEDQLADLKNILTKQGWTEPEINALVNPVIKILKDSGGRTTTTAVARSVTKNIIWIIVILVVAPIIGWMLHTNEALDSGTKYDFIEFLVWGVPAVIGLILNIVAIIRKRGIDYGE